MCALTTILVGSAIGVAAGAGVAAATGGNRNDYLRDSLIGLGLGAAGGAGAAALGVGAAGAGASAGAAGGAAAPVAPAAVGGAGAAGGAAAAGGAKAAATYGGLTAGQWGIVGLGAVATGVSGASAIMQGQAEAKALKRQAELDEIRAGQVQEAAQEEAATIARKARRLQGAQKTAAAANGMMLEGRAESAPSMIEQDTAMEAAWDTQKMLHNANMEAWGYMARADVERMNARNARRTGNLRFGGALLQGGLSTGAMYYGMMGSNATHAATLLA